MASTWLTAGASTFDLTGVQLEVGEHATDFEHRSYGQELALCQRYFQQIGAIGLDGTYTINAGYLSGSGDYVATGYTMPVMMRATPTIANGSTYLQIRNSGGGIDINSYYFIELTFPSTFLAISGVLHQNGGSDNTIVAFTNGPTNGLATLSAEL